MAAFILDDLPDDIADVLAGLHPYDETEGRARRRKPKAEPPPPPAVVRAGPADLDDPEDFFASLGLTTQTDPKVVECSVPTQPIASRDLDPFDPLGDNDSKGFARELALKLAERLLDQGPFSLIDIDAHPFDGDGVYALYYHGDFPLYLPCRSPGATYPLYGGKSEQQGRHTGDGYTAGPNLHKRLVIHAESISQVGLGMENFTYRFVCLPPVWIDFAEATLIELFQPLWNRVLRGFGAKVTGGNRTQVVSLWDTIHWGRKGVGVKPRNAHKVEALVQQRLSDCLRAYEATMATLQERDNRTMATTLNGAPLVLQTFDN